jgi:hypothetical protein
LEKGAVSNNKSSLEQRIVAALTADVLTSAALGALIAEVEQAAVEACQAAKDTRERALDPIVADASALRQQADDLCFERDRLNVALPLLQQQCQQLRRAEEADAWLADYAQIEAQRDMLAAEFAASYPSLVGQLIELFQRAKAFDQEISGLLRRRPNACSTYYLAGVEQQARRSTQGPPLADQVRLPRFDDSNVMAWPVVDHSFAIAYADQVAAMRRRATDSYEERLAAQRAENERVMNYYAQQQKAKEERER